MWKKVYLASVFAAISVMNGCSPAVAAEAYRDRCVNISDKYEPARADNTCFYPVQVAYRDTHGKLVTHEVWTASVLNLPDAPQDPDFAYHVCTSEAFAARTCGFDGMGK